jgi:hypothetical protein
MADKTDRRIKVGDDVVIVHNYKNAKVTRVGRVAAFWSDVGDIFEVEFDGVFGRKRMWVNRSSLVILSPDDKP